MPSIKIRRSRKIRKNSKQTEHMSKKTNECEITECKTNKCVVFAAKESNLSLAIRTCLFIKLIDYLVPKRFAYAHIHWCGDLLNFMRYCRNKSITEFMYNELLKVVMFKWSLFDSLNIERHELVQKIYVDSEFEMVLIKELPKNINYLEFEMVLIKELPKNIKYLEFGGLINPTLKIGMLPESLKVLVFGYNFNQILTPEVLPATLTHLTLGQEYDHRIKKLYIS